MKMKLIILDKDNKDEVYYLDTALHKFQEEVYNSKVDIDVGFFINNHYAIYLVVADDGSYVGFSAFIVNYYFTLREPTIGNSYLYVERGYRKTVAMHLISIQAGRLCKMFGFPLEQYMADGSASEKFVGRMNGKKVYTTYEFGLDEVNKEALRLESKLSLKD
jgi:hypothetical protein